MSKKFLVNGVELICVDETKFDDVRKQFRENVTVDDLECWESKEAMENYTATIFIAKARHYIALSPPDLIQAAEKVWFAAVFSVKELYLTCGGIDLKSHNSLKCFCRFAIFSALKNSKLSDSLSWKLLDTWTEAEKMHQDVYGSGNYPASQYPAIISKVETFVQEVGKFDRKDLWEDFKKKFLVENDPEVSVKKESYSLSLGGNRFKCFKKYDDALQTHYTTSERTFYFDHVFPTNTLENSDFFTIYGELESPELGKLLKEAQILVESKNPGTKYVLRHYKKKPSDYYVSLSGYGVELSLKNNDKKDHYKPKYYDYQNEENETVEEVEEVPIKNPHGFNIKDLLEEHRALNRNPFSLRDQLVEIDTVTPLEEWQLRNLSLQISQYFLEKSLYGARNALEEMKEISQDFPVYASTLANITIDEDFEKNLKEIENLKEKGIKPGSNYLMLNGKKLDIGDGEQLDLYEFVETIQKEYALAERMAKIEWNNKVFQIFVTRKLNS